MMAPNRTNLINLLAWTAAGVLGWTPAGPVTSGNADAQCCTIPHNSAWPPANHSIG
jgi:hypothetical protein